MIKLIKLTKMIILIILLSISNNIDLTKNLTKDLTKDLKKDLTKEYSIHIPADIKRCLVPEYELLTTKIYSNQDKTYILIEGKKPKGTE